MKCPLPLRCEQLRGVERSVAPIRRLQRVRHSASNRPLGRYGNLSFATPSADLYRNGSQPSSHTRYPARRSISASAGWAIEQSSCTTRTDIKQLSRCGLNTKIAKRSPEIAVRIGENELTVPGFSWTCDLPAATTLGDVNSVPAFLHRHDNVGT